jgi:hypothetical protein
MALSWRTKQCLIGRDTRKRINSMRRRTLLLSLLLMLGACVPPPSEPDFASQLAGYESLEGFFDMYWDENQGRLILRIDQLNEPFLYQSSMARGIGSNDLGLDRGQLGSTKIAEFQRSGPKILLMQNNLDYRAGSDDADEQLAVEESFARSAIWGFEAVGEIDEAVFVDATDFFLSDVHLISERLNEAGEGSYQADASRSAIYMPMTRAFPDNSEVEAIVTYVGSPTGPYLATVVPDSKAVTVHLHHSFVRLPDDEYVPLAYDPRVGLIRNSFYDYATSVGDSLEVRYARRHRLEKKDPEAERGEAIEPIVYYVDRGAPEPIRSALVEGASWWNQAYEAAGYDNAFRVELLPEGADPMDVRYNVIQWVHRSTRGWSYGGGVVDPRTGEIIKGKVTLGSLRVRQDYLIAEGLLAPYDGEGSDEMLQMSLARIRQLSAHEVGHTLGVEHNMAASTQDRASVMDYPFPLIKFDDNGNLDLSEAYGVGIGDWDKSVIRYAHEVPDGSAAAEARRRIIDETVDSGMVFVADSDSRAASTANPDGNLWDNGADAIEELEHLLRVRAYALGRFSERNIRPDRPMATLEETLVPVYLLHRFQIRATAKLIGGYYFSYNLRGDGQDSPEFVSAERQRAAIDALLNTISPEQLRLPPNLVNLIPPRPPGYAKSRETFPNATGKSFDPSGPARSAAALTLAALLEPSRAARMIVSNAQQPELPGFHELTSALLGATWQATQQSGLEATIQWATNDLALRGLLALAHDDAADSQVRAIALDTVNTLDNWLSARVSREANVNWRAHYLQARQQIRRASDDPGSILELPPVPVPPGSPIGGGE